MAVVRNRTTGATEEIMGNAEFDRRTAEMGGEALGKPRPKGQPVEDRESAIHSMLKRSVHPAHRALGERMAASKAAKRT